jgi:2-succinyl-5-enolpyruvyl-6-hydroxy-3-cyclohexene-1-carboxylate synthase
LFKPEVEVVVIRSRVMGFFDVSQRATAIVDEITVDDQVDFEWLEAWRKADQALTHAGSNKLDRRILVEAVWSATEPEDDLILGASRLIREADVWAPAKAIRVYSNRGLAGIDGTVATATGISLLQTGTTRALMGDLTLLHDASSLATDPTEPARNIQIIVGNDGGGSIFAGLEMAQSLDSKSFDRLFKTPQNVDVWHLAQAYGWQYLRVETPAELAAALSTNGRILIDVRLD